MPDLENPWTCRATPQSWQWYTRALPPRLLRLPQTMHHPVCSHIFAIVYTYFFFFLFCGAATQSVSWPSHSWGFLDHTQRRTTVGRTALDEWSARRRDLYLTTHNSHSRQISIPPVGFEPTILADERPQTYDLDRAATGTGAVVYIILQKWNSFSFCRILSPP